MSVKHLNIRITGFVQGVSFRYRAKLKADELGVRGFVRNEPDGSLYVEAEGREEAVRHFFDWCRQGPPAAVVDQVKVASGPPRGYSSFSLEL